LLLALAVGCAAVLATPAAAAPLISYPDFSSVVGLQLNGSTVQSGSHLQLTSAVGGEESSAYSTTQVATGQSFSSSFELSMTGGSMYPADGIAFLLQSQGIGAVSTSGLGGAMGYAGVSPSLAVEFDIFPDMGDPGYPVLKAGEDHVGITENGDPFTYLACATVDVPPDAPCTTSLPAGIPIYGAPVYGWVDYNATSTQLSVFVSATATKPAAPTLTTTVNLAGLLGASTWAGFSSATGTFYAEQDVLNWQLAYTPAPVVLLAPAVSGTAQQGQQLSATQGSWSDSPTGFGYQWLQCDSAGNGCTAIAGATAPGYTPQAGDVGHALRVTVTASNPGGATPATSAPTAIVLIAVPANTVLPVISGTAQQGQLLSASQGSWSNSPTGFGYQWLQCSSSGSGCQAITGATSQTYTPGASDVGSTIRVGETASNASGAGASVISNPTAVVLAKPASHTAAPNTRVLTEQISSKAHSAKFRFQATGKSSGFECALVRKPAGRHAKTPSPKYSSCGSKKTFEHLKAGSYVLYVRAVGPGGTDKTPATYSFKIT